jgi:meso-butanediol dehydrogenase/(S,S)-butanediol dehydrogenase/diacetyl reductase
MFDLHDVSVAVTGAGRGLGRGIALGLAGLGARVAVLDADPVGNGQTLELLRENKSESIAVTVDVTDPASVESAIDDCFDAMNRLDLLINNAGVLSVSRVLDMEVSQWKEVLDVNLTGVFLVSRAAARRMVIQGGAASIVSISSVNGKRGDAGLAHYSASKFGVVGFTQALARELASHDITVNALCPGVVRTEMIDKLAREGDQSVEEMLHEQIIPRPQDPLEIASAVAFLHQTRCITGQALNVDGGTVFH